MSCVYIPFPGSPPPHTTHTPRKKIRFGYSLSSRIYPREFKKTSFPFLSPPSSSVGLNCLRFPSSPPEVAYRISHITYRISRIYIYLSNPRWIFFRDIKHNIGASKIAPATNIYISEETRDRIGFF